MHRFLLLLVPALVFAVGACGSSPKCIAGASVACTGPAGCAGGQVCNADGTYGVCVCGAADAGSLPDAFTPDATMTDAGTDATTMDSGTDAGAACNPVEQTGCTPGQRCTWVTVASGVGHVACVPDGAIAELGACTTGSGGFDDCRAGLYCGTVGACTPICDVTAVLAGYDCSLYADVFVDSTGGPTGVGVGSPTCDPVTQTRDNDGASDCGSPDPVTPNLGCYGFPGDVFSCARAGSATLVHGSTAAAPVAGGTPFRNGCAPGYLPILHRSSEDTTVICVALCTPSPTQLGGSTNAVGVPPHDCPARGAGGTNECRYWWSLASDPSTPIPGGNTVGYCIDYTQYTFGAPPMVTPSCADLAPVDDGDLNGVPDILQFGCQPMP